MIGLAAIVLVAVQDQPKVLQRPPHYVDPPSHYEQVVAQYQRGEYDSAVALVARTPAKAFEKPFEDALARLWFNALEEKHRPMRNVTPKVWHDAVDRLLRFLLAVRMLHTEAAFRAPVEQMGEHLRLARTADTTLERTQRDLEPHEEESPYLTAEKLARARHDWVVFIALGYHARGVLDSLPQYLTESLLRYPADPMLELCAGVYDERATRYAFVDDSLVREIYTAPQVASWRHGLEMAVEAYEHAARAPELVLEARLRTGRIRAELNDLKRAREALEPLAALADTSPIKYLALLLLGHVDELENQPGAAAAKYQDALALFPTAQAPFVALSRLSDGRGDVTAARDWLERSFALPMDRRLEPWSYYYAPLVDLQPLVASLREQIRR